MFEDETDLISKLTVFITWTVTGNISSFGTGLLITPRLVLTALHVVCPFGVDKHVPPHEQIRLQVRFEAANQDLAARPGSMPRFYAARLIWPPADSDAFPDRNDIALIALDNDGLEPSAPQWIDDEDLEGMQDIIRRFKLDELTENVRLGARGVSSLTRVTGYPMYARDLYDKILRNLRRQDIAPKKAFQGNLAEGVPSEPSGLMEIQLSNPPELTTAANPMVGMSGASIYRAAENRAGAEIFGVATRFLGGDTLTLAPIPEPPAQDEPAQIGSFWSHLPKTKYVKRVISTARRTERALERLHLLDREEPVKRYLGSYWSAPPPARAYLYICIATSWDGHGAFWKRLSQTSTSAIPPRPPLFDIEAFAGGPVSTTFHPMTGASDCQRIFEDLAGQLKADRSPGIDRAKSIGDRFASGACPRMLFFDVGEMTIFNKSTGQPRDGVAPTLRELMRLLVDWSAQSPAPPSGMSFQGVNPLIAVLTVIVDRKDADEALEVASSLVPRLANLITSEAMPPSGLCCEIYPDTLGHILFADFRRWSTDHLDDPTLADDIGALMDPPFRGALRDFVSIEKALTSARTR